MGTWKMRPPLIDQVAEPLECWAVALECWTEVTSGVPTMLKDEIIEKFRTLGAVRDNNSFRPRIGLPHLESEFGIKNEKLIGKGKLTSEYLQDKLKHSYVLLASLGSLSFLGSLFGVRIFHVVVVYGADKFSFCSMDPLANPGAAFGLTADYVTKRFTDFSSSECVVMWRP